jgi:proteasome accessory factor B
LKYSKDAPVLFVEKPGAAEIAALMRTLSDALMTRKRARFSYHGIYRDETSEREVDLYGLFFQHGNWYAVGHDASRDGIRVFRVARMTSLTVNTKKPGTPDYDIPRDFDTAAYAQRESWQIGSGDEASLAAEVLFNFPLSLWADRNNHGELVARRADGSQVRSFQIQQVGPFLRWILSFEGDAVVTSPPQLVTELQSLAGTIIQRHAVAGDANA